MSVLIDGWHSEVKVQVTCISRVRSATWNYYLDEDLPNGFLVFTGVTSVAFEPRGVIPNDTISDIRAERLMDAPEKYLIAINVDSVDAVGNRKAVEIQIHADSMALESYDEPRRRITE